MSTKYHPLKAGTGNKVHAGVVVGEVTQENRRYGERVGKIYRSVCTLTNTHIVSRPVRVGLLPEGTPITCEHCLRRIQQQEAAEQAK